MENITNLVILTNESRDKKYVFTKKFASEMTENGFQCYFPKLVRNKIALDTYHYYDQFPCNAETVVIIGGDGTFLRNFHVAFSHDLPVVGINLGRLGYLTELDETNYLDILNLKTGNYQVKPRSLIEWKLFKGNRVITDEEFVLNEITIMHSTSNGIADFTVEDSNNTHVRYRADGLILSTSSGSTAYSFSCGGPIIDMDIDAVCITPVCPHSFFNRSIILSSQTEITVSNSSKRGETLLVSMDGKTPYELNPEENITISISKQKLKTITFEKHSIFNTFRTKMEQAELKD